MSLNQLVDILSTVQSSWPKKKEKGRFHLENKFTFAKEIVREAGEYILQHMKEDLHVEKKSSPTDLVTKLDKEVQDLLIKKSVPRYPDDLFCAEEGCMRAAVGQGCVWDY